MKTLKLFSLSLLFVAIASIATANSITKSTCINSEEGLRKLIKEKVESNYSNFSNILNNNGITNFSEEIEIFFIITPEKTVCISSIKSENPVAKEFVNHILDKKELNVDDLLTGRTYRLKLKLYYKS
jgi:hypothetical protein